MKLLLSILLLISAAVFSISAAEKDWQQPYGARQRFDRRPCEEPVRADCPAPWYVYLTATQTSTYSSTLTLSSIATTTTSTVSYRIFTLPLLQVPTTYPNSDAAT